MDTKRLYFLLATATTAGAVAGAYGANVVVTDDPLSGRSQSVEFRDVLRPTPSNILNAIEANLDGLPCQAVDAKHGQGTCVAGEIDYDLVYTRRRGRTRTVWRFPSHDVTLPQRPSKPGHVAWVQNRINSRYCPRIDARYGEGTCDATAVNYLLRFTRRGGQSRTIVELDVPVYCTQVPPPDPDPVVDP